MNRAAQTLGRRAKGVPKKYSKEELAKRTERILAASQEVNRSQRQSVKVTKIYKISSGLKTSSL